MSKTKSELKKLLPSNNTINKINEVCANKSDALIYWRDNLVAVIKKARAGETFNGVLTTLDDIIAVAKYREERVSRVDTWAGRVDELSILQPDNINQLDFMAHHERNALDVNQRAQLTDVTLIYDISDNGEFLRGYLCNNESLDASDAGDQKIISVMDKAFHSWLISHGMLSRNGIIYKNEPVDADDNPTEVVDTKTLDALLNDEKKGLDDTVKKLDEHLIVTVLRQEKAAATVAERQSGDDITTVNG